MRVNTKVVWRIETGEILERESFDYEGPIESCDPGTIAAVAAIIGASTAVGGEAYSLANQPSTPKPSAVPPPLTPQGNYQQVASASSPLSNLYESVPGINPGYAAQWTAGQSGLSNDPRATGNIQAALNQYLGLGSPGDTGVTPLGTGPSGVPGILELLSRPNTGGSPTTGGSNPAIANWVQQALSGNSFQGLQG